MADFTTAARPYAKAAFEIAQEAGSQTGGGFDAWSDRLAFWAALVQNPDMSQRLTAPGLTAQDKARLIETVTGDEMEDLGRNFIRLLAENNRIALLPDIQAIFEGLRSEAEGEIEATVTSAFALTDAQSASIVGALSKRLKRKVRLVSEIDQDLIGGAIIRAGDLVIDGSLRGRVQNMERTVVS
jgi:F-type H+-transporting ATPase subunit delta